MGKSSSILLYSLVEDILNLSKMEAGVFFINISSFWVSDIINEILEIFDYQWSQKKINLSSKVDSRLQDLNIDSDKGRVKQVLLNLMSNAYKFTFNGGILITVKISKNNDFIEFWVKDSGIGIKKEYMSKLFTLFSMIDSSKEINPNGWGIGLTVSKKYLERLGGSIWIKSKHNSYTKAYFKIPLILSNPSQSISFTSTEEFTPTLSPRPIPTTSLIASKSKIFL